MQAIFKHSTLPIPGSRSAEMHTWATTFRSWTQKRHKTSKRWKIMTAVTHIAGRCRGKWTKTFALFKNFWAPTLQQILSFLFRFDWLPPNPLSPMGPVWIPHSSHTLPPSPIILKLGGKTKWQKKTEKGLASMSQTVCLFMGWWPKTALPVRES